MGLIPGLGKAPGEGNNNPHQYSCLESHIDREAWWTTVHAVSKESDTTKVECYNLKKLVFPLEDPEQTKIKTLKKKRKKGMH